MASSVDRLGGYANLNCSGETGCYMGHDQPFKAAHHDGVLWAGMMVVALKHDQRGVVVLGVVLGELAAIFAVSSNK